MIEAVTGIVIGGFIGYVIAGVTEWKAHRQYCNCKMCLNWRNDLVEQATLKEKEDTIQ